MNALKEETNASRRSKRHAPKRAKRHVPKYFVTGGQTGGDTIPLVFPYKSFGIEIKGYMPRGWKREDGKGSEIGKKHGLIEGEGVLVTKLII
mmetsp:Transcript_18329/g.29215  ORF Transcript_18329/g.29215 Transcript_18329/m.29215 type:complete len:92 (+) Transcript_18329:2-277(+)